MKKTTETTGNFLKRLGGQTATWIITIAFFIFAGRILTKVELAAIAVFIIIDSASQAIAALGVGTTGIKKIPIFLTEGKKKEAAALLKSCISIPIIPLVLVSCGVFLLSDRISAFFFKESGYAFLIKLIALGILFSGINVFLSYGVRAIQRFGILSVGQIITGTAQRIFAIGFYFLYGIKGIIFGFIIGSLIGIFFFIYNLRDIFSLKSGLYPIRSLISYSFPYYIEGFARYFTMQGDQLIIGAFLNPASLATYFIAIKFFETLYLIISAWGDALIPKIAELSAESKERVELGYRKTSRYFSLFFIPLCFLFIGLSPFFIDIIGGGKYPEAVLPAIILSTAALVYGFKGLIEIGVFILGRPFDRLKFELIASSLLMFFTVSLIGILDLQGAAVGRLLAVIIAFVYGIFALRKFMDVRFDTGAIKCAMPASLVLAVILLILQYMYYNVAVIPLYLTLGIAAFMFVFSRTLVEEDFTLLKQIIPSKFGGLIKIFYFFGKRKMPGEIYPS